MNRKKRKEQRLLQAGLSNNPPGSSGNILNSSNSSTQAQIRSVLLNSSFSGPLPPPDMLARFDQILPGAAERILGMAERQAAHRQDIETKIINSGITDSRLGLKFGFGIGITALIVAGVVTYLGHEIAGAAIGSGTIIGLVTTFVYGSKQQSKEPKKSSEEV